MTFLSMQVASVLLLTLSVSAGCAGDVPVVSKGPMATKIDRLHDQGRRWLDDGRLDRAERAFDQSRQLAEGTDDVVRICRALNDLGSVAVAAGQGERALSRHRQALALSERSGQPPLILETIGAFATTLHRLGRQDEAGSLYGRGLVLAGHVRDQRAEAILKNNLGLLLLEQGRLNEAEETFRRAMELNRLIHEADAEAANHVNLGLTYERREQWTEAQHEFEEALRLDRRSERQGAIAAGLSRLSRVTSKQGLIDLAMAYAERAAWSYRAQGDVEKARLELQRAVEHAKAGHADAEVIRLDREIRALKEGTQR